MLVLHTCWLTNKQTNKQTKITHQKLCIMLDISSEAAHGPVSALANTGLDGSLFLL